MVQRRNKHTDVNKNVLIEVLDNSNFGIEVIENYEEGIDSKYKLLDVVNELHSFEVSIMQNGQELCINM